MHKIYKWPTGKNLSVEVMLVVLLSILYCCKPCSERCRLSMQFAVTKTSLQLDTFPSLLHRPLSGGGDIYICLTTYD